MVVVFQPNLKYSKMYKAFVASKRKRARPRSETLEGLELPPSVKQGLGRSGGFHQVVSNIPNRRRLEDHARTHLVLSDPTRLRILFALSTSEMCPCVLKRITLVSDSKLSYHLSKLESAGLVSSRKTRNWRIYSITAKGRDLVR
jgi:ArsR family transcriptional regulator